ncbi:MAG: argininosuccinate lyase [Bacillota bacterium]|nr:argininosuccinate lyase [Bacillota bacterium]
MKLWAGRFQKDTDKQVNDFNSSISFDARLYREDISGSIAHATMLGECGIITPDESAQIIEGLKGILADIESGKVEFTVDAEDIHMNIETLLTQRIGDTGKKLHTARSRNDQVALDMRIYMKKETKEVIEHIRKLIEALVKKAEDNIETIMPGYTHLQRAQPITYAHHLMAYANMFKRDIGRLSDAYDRMDEMPLGAGALATTTYPIKRQRTAELLGFARITENSLDSVSDRDFVIEVASALSIIMMHLSRFSEEVILWCSSEFGFIELDDAYSTGSSIMPQKKNPDVAELVRGKTGRVYGTLMTLLTMMKGLPLAYNKDMQEDKEAIFDAVDTVKMCLSVFTPMFETTRLKPQNMKKACSGGFINATDCADYLVRKGMPFRDAYKVVGEIVNYCIQNDEYIETLTLKDFLSICGKFDHTVYDAIALRTCVNGRKVDGGPAPEAVQKQISSIKQFLGE